MLRRGRVVALAALLALLGASSVAAARGSAAAGFAAAARAAPPSLATGALVATPHAASGPVAVDSRHLVWESGPIDGESFVPAVHDRNLRTGATRTLAPVADPIFGLASTSRFVFYARMTGSSTAVVRVPHRGRQAKVLTNALATPIASRGNVVAWGEQTRAVERVVAFDGSGTRRWIVARMRTCTAAGCYRLGAVTVTKDGIVFTRDAVGAQPSQVVRRAFGAKKTQSIAVRHVPQPNLVPSSSGALYYVLSRGWYRWDFGTSRPRPVTFANHPLKQLIRHEGSRWYWLVRHGCSFRLESTRAGNARALAVPKQGGGDDDATCNQLNALAWAGRHAIASWTVASAKSKDPDEDGLHGVIVSARVTPRS